VEETIVALKGKNETDRYSSGGAKKKLVGRGIDAEGMKRHFVSNVFRLGHDIFLSSRGFGLLGVGLVCFFPGSQVSSGPCRRPIK